MIAPAAVVKQDGYLLPGNDRTMADYQARRAYAFELGEQAALQRVISADAYLFLYKALVRLCKDRAFCWPGLDWLAEHLSTSVGTIKRWLDELARAGLIRRKPRPGGLTTLTIIPALDTYDAGQAAVKTEQSDSHNCGSPPASATSELSRSAPLFFVPEQQINLDPSGSTQVIRHTIKRQKKNPPVVGCCQETIHDAPTPIIANAVTEALQAAGLTDPLVINELCHEPLNEIQAIIRYVARQRHVDNPPGLIVALARNKAGAALCRLSRSQSKASFPASLATPPAIREGSNAPEVDPQIATQIQLYLRRHIASEAWSIWFSESRVLDITERHLVVGVPNCLARDHIVREYMPTLIEAGGAVLGRQLLVEVVIDGGGKI